MKEIDKAIVARIIAYCEEINKTHIYFNNDKDLFSDKEKGFVYRNSITMPILQIGELSKNLSDEFRKTYNSIPWREIMGMRDMFAHHYGSMDYDIVWNTSKKDIQELQEYLIKLQ